MAPPPAAEPTPPDDLPFLASISWFDREYRALPPLEMLRRYESGWRFLGVLSEPSAAERRFIRELVERFGSHLRVSA
jgi:hypothetical protein